MWNEPRNWKWMVPGALFTVLTVMGAWLFVQDADNTRWWAWGSVWGVAFVCFLAWIVNIWAYISLHVTNNYVALKKADYETPYVRMMEAAAKIPDGGAAVMAHQRLVWRIKYVAVGNMVTWVLDENPSVQAGFVDFVLQYSNETSLMPISFLSEGSKQYDPEGIVTDREQYTSLLEVMIGLLMCTRAVGNQPPKWIAPWNPDLARRRFGLVEGVYYAEGSEILKAEERARESLGETVANITSDPLRAIKKKIEQNALDGLQQTAEIRKKYQSTMRKIN